MEGPGEIAAAQDQQDAARSGTWMEQNGMADRIFPGETAKAHRDQTISAVALVRQKRHVSAAQPLEKVAYLHGLDGSRRRFLPGGGGGGEVRVDFRRFRRMDRVVVLVRLRQFTLSQQQRVEALATT